MRAAAFVVGDHAAAESRMHHVLPQLERRHLDRVLGLASETYGIGPLYVLYALAVLIPGLAVGVRRLHDIDKSGWWMLIAFIPLIGGIVLLVFAVMEGTSGSNRFGPDPKAGEGGIPVMA
jgi:uncharacterized membrane protein YhaH (DUF805 family)